MNGKYQIKKISPLQTGKIMAVLNAPFGLIYTLIGLSMLNNDSVRDDTIGKVMLAGPILLAALTFVSSVFCCWFYNWATSLVGGVEIELSEKPSITLRQMREDLRASTRTRKESWDG